MTRVYLFGYSEGRGFDLMSPGGRPVRHPWPFVDAGIDGGYAPRRGVTGAVRGQLCWRAQGVSAEQRNRIDYDSEECPQGEYLLHRRDAFTLLAFWDRNQGDRRANCSTTLIVEGEHDASAMLAELAARFPHVLDNLRRAGVELREARP